MKVAIIGAGFTGLATAYHLVKQNHEVTVFERESSPGGLALGFKKKEWIWPLEKHYHHLFVSDSVIAKLAKEVDVPIIFKRPKTSVFVANKSFLLDSPLDLLRFPKLNLFERFRMGMVLFYLKINPFWKPLEKIPAAEWLEKLMGKKSYKMIWEPLLSAKFGKYQNQVPLSWFWARIKKRSPYLGYPEGGFQNLADSLVKKIEEKSGEFFFNTQVLELRTGRGLQLIVKTGNSQAEYSFDKVVITLSSFLFAKIAPDLPNDYKEKLLALSSLGAINLLLILKEQFLKDGTYWLNICDKHFPFLSVVEQTNFMDKKYYGGNHIVYIGNYLPMNHPYFSKTADEILKIYDPYLKKINPNYQLSTINSQLFKAPFAQPIITLNYSKIMPSMTTPIKNVYLANIEQVYPWDRGTNYAIELGEKVARLV